MKFIKYFVTSIFCLGLLGPALAQNHYSVNVNIKGLNDSLLVMASYLGDKQFVVDTAYADKQFNYLFTGDSLLPEGMYIVATSGKAKLFDFIISGDQQHVLTGDQSQLPSSLQSSNNDQNKVLFEYITFLSLKQKQMNGLLNLRKKFVSDSDSAKVVENQVKLLDDEVKRYIKGIINSWRGEFISVFLNMMQEPELIEPPVLPNGRSDSSFAFRQYKAHYWDNIDLSDERVLRTPIVHSKVETYLTNLTPPVPDSLIASIDRLFGLSKGNKETFKYLSWYLTLKYEVSDIMGYDAIFVHLVDRYFGDPKMVWMNKTVKENLVKRANTLRPLLIGKQAPSMILLDTVQQPVSLLAIPNAYTIVYFWDPECSHCKKETPMLKTFYDKNKNQYDLEVYAVCMDTSWKDMKEYIIKNNTTWKNVNGFYSMTPDFRELYDVHTSPVMYLLDKNKKIIAKRVLTEQMKGILEHLTGKQEIQ